MIREISTSELKDVYKLVAIDKARNYFILNTLDGKVDLYDKIYGQWENENLIAVLLKRKSGTLQFYAKGSFDVEGFVGIISTLEYKAMIGPRSILDIFLSKEMFTYKVEGAFISKREKSIVGHYQKLAEVQPIEVSDLDKVVHLYRKVFHSFPSKEIMKEKLLSSRGRGVCVKKGKKIITVAQTDYESEKSALVVGVATDPDYQNQGLANKCLMTLITDLNRDLYLQYDNPNAGNIYKKLNFKIIDRIRHYVR